VARTKTKKQVNSIQYHALKQNVEYNGENEHVGSVQLA
jgi:hypothetical protein